LRKGIKKGGNVMKRNTFLVSMALLFTMAWINDGLCQLPSFTPIVGLANLKHNPIVGNQLQFTIVLTTNSLSALWGVKRIKAVNATDPTDAYEFSLAPSTQHLTCDLVATGNFNNQHGVYNIIIDPPPPGPLTTSEFPLGVVPYPTPRKLRVSFESGLLTPTLSFDPIPDFVLNDPPTTKYYQIRIYDRDYTRLIYRSPPLSVPEVIFPDGRVCPGLNCRSTAEDLILGERYIFRADVTERLGPLNFNSASSFVSFKVPKKITDHHFTNEDEDHDDN
jgi:hypothetical protein